MSRTFNRATSWIVRRPWLSLVLILVVSSFAVVGYVNPDAFDSVWETLNPPEAVEEDFDDPVVEPDSDSSDAESSEYSDVPSYDFDGQSILLAQSDDFFTPRGAECIRAVVRHLRDQPQIWSVSWMDEIPPMNAFGLSEPILPRGDASIERFSAAKVKALAHPFIVGQLMSADAKALIFPVNFNDIYLKSDRDCIEGLRELAEEKAKEFPDVDVKFSVTGRRPIWLTAVKTQESNQFLYQLIAYSMIGLMSVILFRGVTAVIVVALAPALGVFLTLGFVNFLDFQNNPFNDVVLPVLVSLVGFTDGVHLMVQIRRNRVSGMSPKDAATFGIEQVGLACFLTSLTTAIGFGSLWLAEHQIVQQFGTCCVVGVFCSFFAVVTTIPLACSTWLGNWIHVGHDKSLVDKNLNKIGGVIDFVLERKKVVGWIGLATTFILLAVSLTLRPDEKQTNALPANSEASIALAEMDRVMGGLSQVEVAIGWDTRKIDSESLQVVNVIKSIDELLRQEELVGHPISICSIIDALPGDGPVEDRFSMADLLPAQIKRTFYSDGFATVSFRVQDLGIATYGPVFERIVSATMELEKKNPGFRIFLQGDAVWRWENLYQIVVDLATSLGTASIIIFVVLAVVYRSLRIGLISIIPNIFPLTVAGAYLVITGQKLEVVTVCAFTVCLGIAVDDTIHFLTRYQEEHREGESEEAIIRRAFIGVGTALIITTIVLVSGFSTVLFSDARDHQTFAMMGAITISSALFGDLVFLPAILARFAKPKS